MTRTGRFTAIWLALAAVSAGLAQGGSIGKVVAIGGHAADLALDEQRGVLYVANFTANRIEVISLATGVMQTSMNVSPQPVSLALSPNGRYLAVAHYGKFDAGTPNNALTLIDLRSNSRQTFALANPGVGVAFGIDNKALVLTTQEFLIFDPESGSFQILDTIAGAISRSLPQPPANFPPNIVAASLASSGDGYHIYGITDTHLFHYNLAGGELIVFPYISRPPQAPRVVTVPFDGSYFVAGWAVFDSEITLVTQFPDPVGILNVGSYALDSTRGILYGQIPVGTSEATPSTTKLGPPILQVMDVESLGVHQKLHLQENLAGKSVLSADGSTMYAISDSGVTIIPVGQLTRTPQVASSKEDLVFRGNFCDRNLATQEITILDPSGANTDFTLTTKLAGVTINPSKGAAPATVTVTVDPSVYQSQKGTVTGFIEIQSSRAVNVPDPVRILINNREPDQRGSFVNVPGKLVDILADPTHDRFFVLRQDRNELLVFDGASQTQIATLRTANTPTQMAITFDRKYLLVGHDNSQIIKVWDLDTLAPSAPVRMTPGHYPRSIAVSGRAILAASRVFGPKHMISRVDMATRTATALPSLGVYENDIDINTILVGVPNGNAIMAAEASGNLLLYDANVDTFTISRKDFDDLSGAYAASNSNQFIVGDSMLNTSLVPVHQFGAEAGKSSGFAFIETSAIRTTAADSASPGLAQRVDPETGEMVRSIRTIEAPMLAEPTGRPVFTRTVAPLSSRASIVNLSTSGLTVLPFDYDAAAASPRIARVVNSADGTQALAAGGLFSLTGSDLSAGTVSTQLRPLPTVLGESCLTANGTPVPVFAVSRNQITGQFPYQTTGTASLVLRTSGGISEPFTVSLLASAPTVLRTGQAGDQRNLPAIMRTANQLLVTPSNPVHRGDVIVIYLIGLGETTPGVPAGVPAPDNPPAAAVNKPQVTLGGVGLPLNFAGLVPGEIGLYQISVSVPRQVPVGLEVALVISQANFASNLTVRVVD